MNYEKYHQALWEVRKKYKRYKLTKTQNAEAMRLYLKADENIDKFKELMGEYFGRQDHNTRGSRGPLGGGRANRSNIPMQDLLGPGLHNPPRFFRARNISWQDRSQASEGSL